MSDNFGYIGLTLTMFIVVSFFGMQIIRKTYEKENVGKMSFILIASLLLWFLYTYLIAKTGIPQDFSLPPKGPALLVLPAFLFIGLFMFRHRNKKWISNLPLWGLIVFQCYRVLIETLFVFSVKNGTIHPNMTIEGYNYDMIFALSSIVIGWLVFKKVKGYQTIALYWNYFGLMVIASIIFIVITTMFIPGFYSNNIDAVPKEFGTFPFVLVASFLMPLAVFIHVLTIKKLKRSIKND